MIPAHRLPFRLSSIGFTAGGQLVSQAIVLGSMLLISRLYSPASFGEFTLFSTGLAFFAPLASLSLNNAIAFARRQSEVFLLGSAAVFSSAVVGLLCALSGIVYFIVTESTFAWAPVFFGATLVARASSFWAEQASFHNSWIKAQVQASVMAALLIALVRIAGGVTSPSSLWLMAAALAGALYKTLSIFNQSLSQAKHFTDTGRQISNWKRAVRRNRSFVWHMTPTIVLRSAALALPPWFLAAKFGTDEAGQYGFAFAAVIAPMSLLIDSAGNVFTPNLARQYREDPREAWENCLKLSLVFGFIGSCIFLAFILIGDDFVLLVFGSQWGLASEMLKALVVWISFSLLARPLIVLIPVLGLQREAAIMEFTFLLLRAAGLILGGTYYGPIGAVLWFSVLGAVQSLLIAVVVGFLGRVGSSIEKNF